LRAVEIRLAQPADIPALIAFQREGWFEDYSEVIPEGYADHAMGIYGTEDAIRQNIEADTLYIVAQVGERVVACATTQPLNTDEAEIWWIHTSKSHRGQGIGRQLINHIIVQMRGQVRSLCVTTFQGYTPTLRFYERLGFVVQKTYIYETGHFRIPNVRLCQTLDK
jgi:ribosomal protein S18 acetylase RimI-like enzyme